MKVELAVGGKNKKVEIRGCYCSLIDSFFF